MLSYCFKCWKNIEIKNPKVARTKNRRIIIFSKYAVCDSKKSKFLKEQEASRLLSSIGIKTTLNEIPLVGSLFLRVFNKLTQVIKWMKQLIRLF